MKARSTTWKRNDERQSRVAFRRVGLPVFGGLVLLYLMLPILLVAATSLDPGEFFTFPPNDVSLTWYREFLSDQYWRSALLLSLQIASLTAIAAALIGTLAGIAIARTGPKTRIVLNAALVIPLVLPIVLLAISFYGVVLRAGMVGTLPAFVVGNTLQSAPLVALLVRGAAAGVDRRLEYASLACGAGPWRTLRLVTIPLVAPAAMVGGVFAFLLALGDVVMSTFIAAPGREPLAVMMFVQVQKGTSQIVTAASTFLIVAPWAALLIVVLLRRLAVARGRKVAEVFEMATTA